MSTQRKKRKERKKKDAGNEAEHLGSVRLRGEAAGAGVGGGAERDVPQVREPLDRSVVAAGSGRARRGSIGSIGSDVRPGRGGQALRDGGEAGGSPRAAGERRGRGGVTDAVAP